MGKKYKGDFILCQTKSHFMAEKPCHHNIKLNFMSLNRLRLNQTVSGQIPVTISLTEKTRMAENLLWARSHDASTSFESMELLLNPYGITPLTALCMFHTDTRCRLSYTVVSDFCMPWHYDSMNVYNQSCASSLRLMREHG